MKTLPQIVAFLLLLLVSCTGNRQSPEPAGLTGRVVGIADGDTFTLLTEDKRQVKVRLHGIDSPERGQAFGQVARQKLSDLVFGQTVSVEEKDIDRYGRTVGIAYDSRGRCINELMLQAGLAWHYTEYDQNPAWTRMQQQAKAQKTGLWADAHPTPPWDWRKAKRQKKAA